MSRVGKKPVPVADGVTISVQDAQVLVKGPKGELNVAFEPALVQIQMNEGEIAVTPKEQTALCRARQGLYRTLLANAIEGVTKGYSKRLEIKGVGYRGSVKGSVVELNLGFSHLVEYPIPEGIEVKFDDKSQVLLTVSGIDKQKVGQVAAEIRSYRKPEPYKGKGIRYEGEYVRRKAGKSAKA